MESNNQPTVLQLTVIALLKFIRRVQVHLLKRNKGDIYARVVCYLLKRLYRMAKPWYHVAFVKN